MDVSDIELFKKSKIIEIGSVEKKLELREVGGFSKKSENPRFSYLKSGILSPKLYLQSKLTKKQWNSKKFFILNFFSFDPFPIVFGIH